MAHDAPARHVPVLEGEGLVLRPWDSDLVRQMAAWGEYGFPYHAFDLGHLRDAGRAEAALADHTAPGRHRHYVAVEGGVAVGRCSVNLEDEAGLYLWAVHVPPERQGRGIARRMLAVLIGGLEREFPGRDFVLTSNTFAAHAHRAYLALGFRIAETRWHLDREIADRLWRVTPAERDPIARHIRFHDGRWQVRAHVFRRTPGAPMDLAGAQPGGESGQRPQAPFSQ
jgi:RimJ/RimL family protein N-acetyltransferase